MSTVATNVGIGAAAVVASVAAAFYFPFEISIPGTLPPPPMEVVCTSLEMVDLAAPPVLTGCQYQGYPVAVVAPSPTPF
jgi:hypothetical protein